MPTYCPSCGKKLQNVDAKFCNACGYRFPKFCTICGNKILDPEAKFCEQCGHKINDTLKTTGDRNYIVDGSLSIGADIDKKDGYDNIIDYLERRLNKIEENIYNTIESKLGSSDNKLDKANTAKIKRRENKKRIDRKQKGNEEITLSSSISKKLIKFKGFFSFIVPLWGTVVFSFDELSYTGKLIFFLIFIGAIIMVVLFFGIVLENEFIKVNITKQDLPLSSFLALYIPLNFISIVAITQYYRNRFLGWTSYEMLVNYFILLALFVLLFLYFSIMRDNLAFRIIIMVSLVLIVTRYTLIDPLFSSLFWTSAIVFLMSLVRDKFLTSSLSDLRIFPQIFTIGVAALIFFSILYIYPEVKTRVCENYVGDLITTLLSGIGLAILLCLYSTRKKELLA